MRIVVIGGTGLIGTEVVHRLQANGHDAVAASPTTGVNTITEIGLDAAFADAHVVIDVADAPSFDDEPVLEYFLTSGRNIARAEARHGITHHIALSVVGADRLPNSGYMRAKVAQEALIRTVGIPHSILRSTQTFELLRGAADAATFGGVVRISPALVQPVAARDVGSALADIAVTAPTNAIAELAGPEPGRLVDVVARMLCAQRDRRRVEAAPDEPYYGTALDDDTLMPSPGARIAPTRLDDWVRDVIDHHQHSRTEQMDLA